MTENLDSDFDKLSVIQKVDYQKIPKIIDENDEYVQENLPLFNAKMEKDLRNQSAQ